MSTPLFELTVNQAGRVMERCRLLLKRPPSPEAEERLLAITRDVERCRIGEDDLDYLKTLGQRRGLPELT